ncbi:MAG: low specificity L-threonine aldolase [Oscillospiraceae bacterium]
MVRFNCDYAEGTHPLILERLLQTNSEQSEVYGLDDHSEKARTYIKKACACPEAEVHFLSGGTQTNLTVIDAVLRPYQGIISACTGHINVHETGAIEATGHKVLSVPSHNGKLTGEQVLALCRAHYSDRDREHTVQPGMIYISHPSENGTSYTKTELMDLRRACDEYSLPLYLDGARLGYGLMAPGADLTLEDIAKLCDVFYIGGTKVGAMFGEAVVITNARLLRDFRYMIKQCGGMLAKGRMLGIQFEVLFENGLYFEISRHAVTLSAKLKNACLDCGCPLLYETTANQLFPILPNNAIKKLQEKYIFFPWENIDDGHSAVRLCTSWATLTENVDAFISDLMKTLAE